MTDLSRALKDLVELFEGFGAQYVVMGGIAVRVYGIPRPTHDVDFTAAIDRDRLSEFYQAVRDAGYTVPEQYESGWVDEVGGMPLVKVRLYLDNRGIDIDIFLAESDFQKQLLARRRRESLDGLSINMVSPEDLILLKLLASRPRDIADIGDVLFTQGQLDEPYMLHWAEQLGTKEALERLLAEHSGE
jgi:predicted nucleotidyltransferase